MVGIEMAKTSSSHLHSIWCMKDQSDPDALLYLFYPYRPLCLRAFPAVALAQVKVSPNICPILLRSTRYRTALPDAYERLILDVINGDKRLFIRNDELEVRSTVLVAWQQCSHRTGIQTCGQCSHLMRRSTA